ncbi:MAG TPA: glycosyltransferase family 1 protein [Anaerolineae bacterium]|nr:glycosyltransferase family 1 protein [Anaerolineae bacterium]
MTLSIAFDATPLLIPRSGIGSYTLELLRAYDKLEHTLRLTMLSNRPLPAPLNLPHILQKTLPFPSRWLWLHTKFSQAIQAGDYDLAHFPNNSAPLNLKKPYVLTIHDASLYRFPECHPWQRKVTIKAFLPAAARRAAQIITVSDHAKRELMHYLNLPESKFTVVHEAAGEQFRPIQDPQQIAALNHKYNLPAHFILSVGTQEPRKNLPRLIEAYAQHIAQDRHLKRYKLLIVGGNGWGQATLDAQIERLGLTKQVIRLGFVPDADLPALYTRASLFVYPSLHEGFGLPPLEAMACGTPVLTSLGTAMEEVCDNGAAFCDPLHVEDIGRHIATLLSNGEQRLDLRQRGFQTTARYSWQRTAPETLQVYANVLASKRHPAHNQHFQPASHPLQISKSYD